MSEIKIGYISKSTTSDKTIFKYIEANAIRRIGPKKDSIKVSFLYGTYDYEEVQENTKMMLDGKIMIISEPFFTDDKMKERCELWCTWANRCENREYSFFNEVDK